MGIQTMVFLKTHFVYLCKKMFLFIRVLWVSFFTLFGFTMKYLMRFITQKNNSNFKLVRQEEDDKKNDNLIELKNNNDVGEVEEKISEPILRFHFPTYEEFLLNSINDVQSTSHSILCENSDDKFGHVETKDDYVEPKIDTNLKSFHEFLHVEEIAKRKISSECDVFGSENNRIILDEFLHVGSVIENVDVKENLNVIKVENEEELHEQVTEDIMENGSEFCNGNESLINGLTNNEAVMGNGGHLDLPSDDESLESDNDSDSLAPSSESSFRSSFIDSFSDGCLSDIDFEKAFEVDTSTEFGWNEVKLTKEGLEKDLEFKNLSKGYEADDFEDEDEDEDILEELKKLESNLQGDNDDFGKEHDSNKKTDVESKQEEEKQSSGEQLSSDSDELNGLETQWEHQDLVEQLKMEIKKVRAIGLPTILEESESSKIMDDLKPWKIEEKYKLGSTLDELNKFYKSYKERMRKLDILNYQKMYAIGFLRLKDPLKSISKNRISTPALTTIVSLDCWPCKPKSSTEINQAVMKKFSKELESDLEMVYVGQMCLSWEFLRWQYGKALELWETDPHGLHRYNDVAGKFQTFQVLLTRFLEDEPFEGPRVQNYVKKRCFQRNLLQVPLIRDDDTRDRRTAKKVISSKEALTSLQLVEVIEESIRLLFKFIKADKDSNYLGLLNCRRSSNAELQNPADASLFDEIQSNLQKKQKKLKELIKSGKCILKKIRKHQHEEDSDNALQFFSQVDLRLVSRVLSMPRLSTEQLVWCSDKLNNIRVIDRRLHVDPAVILLFPCS